MITISDTPFEPADALKDFSKSSAGAGGIVSFSGHVRPHAKSGPVSTLYLEAHPAMTLRGIEQAVSEANTRWTLIATRVIHRIGSILPNEAIVFVATAAEHRRPAFQAADFLMDYLKTDAIFWKKEAGPHGTQWIEPRPEDYADKARWHEAKNG